MAPQRPVRWAGMGAVLGLLTALLWLAPAQWLARAIDSSTQGRVQLLNTRGTVWHGQGDLVLSAGTGSRGRTALPQGLHWTLGPGWRQGPVLQIQVHAPCCTDAPLALDLRPVAGGAEWRFEASRSRWPASLLTGLGTPWNTLRPEGLLVMDTPGLLVTPSRSGPRLEGQLFIEALDLATRASPLKPLGSYRLGLQGMGAQAAPGVVLSTLSGGLQLKGEGLWRNGRLDFGGEAWAAPGQEAALSHLLGIIGRRSGGRTVLSFGQDTKTSR
jgi:general secretion pathway protein N